jgi:hypothetical protein
MPKDSSFGLHCVGECAERNRTPLNKNQEGLERRRIWRIMTNG